MHDEAGTYYKHLIDNMRIGLKFLKEEFNITPKIGWFIDPFGHSSATSHILSQMNFEKIVLTRIDGGGRAGCALSMKIATGCPIKYMSSGEKLEQFDEFYPERIASKILDMGDIVSFVEKAQEVVDEEEALKLEQKIKKGEFDLNDFLGQLRNLKKLGGLASILNFLPGAGKIKDFMQMKGFDDNLLKKKKNR